MKVINARMFFKNMCLQQIKTAEKLFPFWNSELSCIKETPPKELELEDKENIKYTLKRFLKSFLNV